MQAWLIYQFPLTLALIISSTLKSRWATWGGPGISSRLYIYSHLPVYPSANCKRGFTVRTCKRHSLYFEYQHLQNFEM